MKERSRMASTGYVPKVYSKCGTLSHGILYSREREHIELLVCVGAFKRKRKVSRRKTHREHCHFRTV